jgi:hypothetical protein
LLSVGNGCGVVEIDGTGDVATCREVLSPPHATATAIEDSTSSSTLANFTAEA